MFHTYLLLGCTLLASVSVSASFNNYDDGSHKVAIIAECEPVTHQLYSEERVLVVRNSRTDCYTSMTLKADNPKNILILKITSVDCSNDASLTITGETKSDEYCSGSSLRTVISTSNFLTITYYNGLGEHSNVGVSLEFYYTQIYEGPCNGDDDDDNGKFQCSTKRNGIAMCIDAVLMCDGVDNCGDWSDESASACGMSTGAVIAISVSCGVVGLVLIICIVGLCVIKANRGKQNTGGHVGTHYEAELGPTTIAASETQDPTACINGAGECPILAPPSYIAGTPYATVVMTQGALDTASAYFYDDVKPPTYEEAPIHKSTNDV